jgi:NTE family protein
LALSGGGFRAAFLHLGVLAQMARRGLLRQVDVVSAVSGGATVGALYCLRLKWLPAGAPDASYVGLMQQITADFLRVVQRNLRMRVYLNPLASLRLPASRLGELFGEHFYNGAALGDLDMERPALILNTTSLNTGEVVRLEPQSNDRTPLGLAVAAAAAFPGVFAPIDLRGARLGDGGIHDDRGLESLVKRGCDRIIASDASYQLDVEAEPSLSVLGMTLRSAKIVLAQVRQEQLQRHHPDVLMHLRQEGEFGVAREVVDRLGRFRIDFDSFTEVEAYSLMLHGYRMADRELANWGPVAVSDAKFPFEQIGPWMERPTAEYLRQIEVGSQVFFKVFRLSRPLGLAALLVALAVVGLVSLLWVPVWALLLIGAVALIQIQPWGPRWLRRPVERVSQFLVRGLLPALGSPLVAMHLLTFDRLFLWLGRVSRLERPQTAGPAEEREPRRAIAGA